MFSWYFVCFDTMEGYFEGEYDGVELDEVLDSVHNELKDAGGGHADIFDVNDNFVDDVEV